jgi:tetratricopeptide (TPR) repeat protein
MSARGTFACVLAGVLGAASPALSQAADALLGEARALMQAAARTSLPPAHYERIEELLLEARRLAPQSTAVLLETASLYAKTGRAEESARLLHEALALDPRSSQAHAALGYVLRYAGHFDASIAAYRRAQELDPTLDGRVAAEDQIAKSLIYLGDYEAALAAHVRLSGWLGESGRSPDEKMLFYQGVAQLYRGDRTTAIVCFDAAVRQDPESLWSQFARGYRAIAQDGRAELRRLADAIDAQSPVDGERHYRLVHFYAHAGDAAAAVAHLRTTLKNGFFAAPYLARDPLTSSLHDLPDWKGLIAEAQARHAAFPLSNEQIR